METLTNVLTWILEIGCAIVIVLGALLWLRAASKSQSTARSYMALVYTFVFFIVVVLRPFDFDRTTVRWLTIIYGVIAAFYIVARMIEHRAEIQRGKTKKSEKPSE